jgi:ATP-dependent protease Clp ATPase subunit
MIKLRRLRCSFCGKRDSEVAKLVAGPRVYICDACVAVASRLMEGGADGDGQTPEAKSSVWRRLSARARQFLRGGDARRVGRFAQS